jgi:23S rRNA pseudouridine1911/1915/1917 synthase
MTKIEKFTVDELKTRLDKFLAGQLKALSRSKIQRAIELGLVTVNDEAVTAPHRPVRQGDIVIYQTLPEKKPGAVNIPLHTLYNNHGLLIIDKPAGLAVHPGAGFKGDSLAQALLYHFKDIDKVGEEGRSGIVHRLDKDTSGVMLVALTSEMYEYLKDAFEQRKIHKEYIGLVKGDLAETHGLIDKPLGKSKKDFRKYTTDTQDMQLQKPSLSEFWVIEHLSDGIDEYTLIRVKLHTGRTHQIRVHFSSLGFPLVGDELYGGKNVMKLGLERQFLHANSIEVRLPSGETIQAESELPKDLKAILLKLNSKKAKLL